MQGLRKATEILSLHDAGTDGHWQDIRIYEFLDKFGKFSAFRELIGEGADLFRGWYLSGEQEPEHALRDDLLAVDSGGELFLAIRDGQSMEADTLVISVSSWPAIVRDMHEPRLGQERSLPREGP